MNRIERAIISVSDKKGVIEFAAELDKLGVEIISTGGTAKILKEAGLRVKLISDLTGFPEILDGRVKTLHPKVHGGLLGIRDNTAHKKQMEEHGIIPIDLLVVNLYPFQETVARDGVSLAEAIENIDIGGPSMLRSSAKNYRFVGVVVNPNRYSIVIDELKQNHCALSEGFKFRLAQEAFAHTARYDLAIANYFEELAKPKGGAFFPDELALAFRKVEDLRYGENPHQKAAFYQDYKSSVAGLASAKQLSGKVLSFNNLLDLDGACKLIQEFSTPASVILKHNNPCGAALGENILDAYQKAVETDPVSAFGGILGFNRVVDIELARAITQGFVEAILAPSFTEEALSEFKKKKNLILLALESVGQPADEKVTQYDLKRIQGGLLIQESDRLPIKKEELKVVTQRQPTVEEIESLIFAWTVAKHVKSNAIVFARGKETAGIGAGQMSRVDSVKIAIMKARKDLKGAVMASDAFFPFRDGIDVAAEAGIRAVIQPGGSIRDAEVVEACNQKGMAMVITGVRHFRH